MHTFIAITAFAVNIVRDVFPLDTRHKLNVHKTFNRRLGRLLNVLCTLNLHPVSRGTEYARRQLSKDEGRTSYWLFCDKIL